MKTINHNNTIIIDTIDIVMDVIQLMDDFAIHIDFHHPEKYEKFGELTCNYLLEKFNNDYEAIKEYLIVEFY